MKQLTCYQIYETAPRLVPGRSERAWMDSTDRRFAYRCLPLSIANSMGWEVLTPSRVIAEWNGNRGLSDLVIRVDSTWADDRLASSHFGHGILTFHTGYLFRTEPGVAVWARGAPNLPKDGIAPLDGIIETDWLTFTFTMNWQFTRPGRIVFEKDEPFCFITPIEYRALDSIEPEILSIHQDPHLLESFQAWRDARRDFNRRLREQAPDAVKQGWQKWYPRGGGPEWGQRICHSYVKSSESRLHAFGRPQYKRPMTRCRLSAQSWRQKTKDSSGSSLARVATLPKVLISHADRRGLAGS